MKRRALVTGASRGLGFAAARFLATSGHDITLSARTLRSLEMAAASLRKTSPDTKVNIVQCDLEDRESVEKLIGAELAMDKGIPDVFVHVAGGPPLFKPGKESENDFRRYMESHSFSLWSCMRAFAPVMESRKFGRIIAIMSRAVGEPRSDNPLSAAVRLPAWAMMKSYTRSTEFRHVTFNALLPGLFETDRFADVCKRLAVEEGAKSSAIRDRFLSKVPARRPGRPEELGALCAYLASDLGGYVNGQRIAIDGGSSVGI